ncbi:MAG: hypothetical protein ACFFA3_12355 [Promethearchaeota archaeon]
MNKKNRDISIPEILEIEEKEFEEKKPPNKYVIDYKIINETQTSNLEEKER